MSKLNFKITDGLRQKVVMRRAYGESLPHIVTEIMKEHEKGLKKDLEKYGEQGLRTLLRDRLRSCDPKSRSFSQEKWGRLYRLHSNAAKVVIEQEIRDYFTEYFQTIRSRRDKINKRIEEIEHLIEEAHNPKHQLTLFPTTTGEYATLQRNLIRWTSLLTDIDRTIAEIGDSIHERGDTF